MTKKKSGEPEHIGQRIQKRRESLKIKQRDVAEALGVLPMTVSRWERGANKPPSGRLEALASVLGVDKRWLAFGGADLAPKDVAS